MIKLSLGRLPSSELGRLEEVTLRRNCLLIGCEITVRRVGVFGTLGLIGTAVVGAGALAFESKYRGRQGNELDMVDVDWSLKVSEPQHYQLIGEVELVNQTDALEIMVPEVTVEPKLLSKASLDGVTWKVSVTPEHPDEQARSDDYWFAYIVKIGKRTKLRITVDITGPGLSNLQVAWVKVHYMTYGPEGRIPKIHHAIVPLSFPSTESGTGSETAWRDKDGAELLPVKTHLLTPLDNPVEVVKRYVLPHAKEGDVVTIGETPIAIMQNRMRHPSTVKPGWVAKRVCYFFLPTSSLATACGLQVLVDNVGAWRVFAAFLGGAIARVLGRRGGFYELAGEQARLIDDVTGTLPPYDQFIVLGPQDPQGVVDEIKRETGLACAIVDVNDLQRVKVLSSTAGVSEEFLNKALRSNPAGNADEQTPVVLLRPSNSSAS